MGKILRYSHGSTIRVPDTWCLVC